MCGADSEWRSRPDIVTGDKGVVLLDGSRHETMRRLDTVAVQWIQSVVDLGDRSEMYQVSFSCEMYVSVVQPPEGIQSGVPAQISVHVTNELALLILPGARLNFLSRVSQVSLATEEYVDLHSIVAGSGSAEQSSLGMQIGVFSQISLQVRKVFAERIEPWSNS